MISRIFRFTRAEARKAMVPLVRVEAVPEETTLAGVIELVRREGFTRIPVFQERIFNIVGVVHAFDLLEAPDLSRAVAEVMRSVSYFSEATPLDEILVALQRTRETLAVVVDEYGGASGIISMEDLLEEVVGDIEDEHDVREEHARVVGPQTLVVSAQAAVAELNERFGLTPAGARRICYRRRPRGRAARPYSDGRGATEIGRRDDQSDAQRRSRSARSGDHA